MAGPVDRARAEGYNEDEIQNYLAPRILEAQQQGYSQEEIGAYLGVKSIDHAAATTALAKRVASEVNSGGARQGAVEKWKQAGLDVATVYGPLEAAMTLASGAALGFPTYLGVGGAVAASRAVGFTDADPKEVAQRYSNLVTYKPFTEAGKRTAESLLLPINALMETGEEAGHKAADATDSPVLGAITEATVQMLPSFLVPALGRALKGKLPTNSDMYSAAKDIAPEASPRAMNKLADSVQTVYEKSGIDPATVRDEAMRDPTVKADLLSSNIEVPKAFGAEEPKPATPESASKATPEQQAILDRVSVGEKNNAAWSFDKFYTAVKDDLYPIAKIEKALTEGDTLAAAESPYTLARLVRGSGGKATQFLDYGTFDWNTYENTGPGLKQILDPFKNDMEGMRAYMVSRRAEELHLRGIETGVPAEEAAAVVKGGKRYAAAFEQLQEYQNSLTKYMKDSGILSDQTYAAMLEANKDYIPFHRVFEEGAKSGGAGAGLSIRNPLRAIKGSGRTIVDPIESIIKNTYLYTALAERNAVGRTFGDLVKANPDAAADLGVSEVKTKIKAIEVSDAEIARAMMKQEVDGELGTFAIFRPKALNPTPDQIRYFEDGKPVTLELPPEVAEAFNATDRQSAGMLLRMMAVPARTLRAGAILTPDFMTRNLMRDQLTAFSFSKNGYIPVWDMMRGAVSIAKKDGDFQSWLKSGGANSAMVSIDREYLQQHIATLDKETGLMSRTWNLAKSPLEFLRISSELIENATRLGEFKRAMSGEAPTKQNIQGAGFESREVTLDFQRIGAQTRGLNMIAAFMNAGVEGLDRTVRAFKDNPIGTSAKVAAGITLPSILLWYANNSTPERQARWREIPNWERDLFWIAMTDENTYRIPKPFELGVVFGSVPERLLDKFASDKPEAMQGIMSSVGRVASINVMPTGAVPLLEHMTNYSFFTDNPLIPSRLEGILPEYQYHEYTTQLARSVGQIVGAFPGLHNKSIASPVVIDNYIREWTGGLGIYVEQALDAGLRKAGVLPDPPLPAATLADIPVVKAFVVRYPSASAQSVQDFYTTYNEYKTVYATFQYLVKSGDTASALKEAKLDMSSFARLDGIHATLGELNKVIRMTYKNPEMTPSDKRQLIDSMYGQMIALSRAGNEAMRDIDKALK